MSLNNIVLSDLIVRELYKDTLIPPASAPTPMPTKRPAAASITSAPSTPAPPIPAPDPSVYKFLGSNRRKITLLVHSPGSPFMPDDQLTFLTKILEACRLTIADVAIVNNAAVPVTIAAIKQQLQPVNLLLFGLEPTAIRLPINFPQFKLQPYDNITYLSAPALDLLVQQSEESKLLKSKLWVCLKSLLDV